MDDSNNTQDLASFVAEMAMQHGGGGGKRLDADPMSPTMEDAFGIGNENFHTPDNKPNQPSSVEQQAQSQNGTPQRPQRRRKNDRKETMKLYMRNYRRRQKQQMETMPEEERERILEKQRMRVRMRVRRHRLRKKLRASGLPADEIERRLQEVVPTVANRAARAAAASKAAMGALADPAAFAMPDMASSPMAMLDGKAAAMMYGRGGSLNTRHIAAGASPAFQVDENLMDSSMQMEHFRQGLSMQAHGLSHHQHVMPKLDFESATHGFTGSEEGVQASGSGTSGYEDFGTPCAAVVKLSPRRWSVTQVGIFLDGLELGHLKCTFEQHRIDGRMLLDLTLEMLHDMNITPSNTQAELMSAIASLKKVACVS